MSDAPIKISAEVQEAIGQGRPIVALESTVIAHGLPRPLNLQVANRLEQAVSQAGAVPATIGILEGTLKAGLSQSEILRMAEQSGIRKVSTRDLPIAIVARWNGATTVASTLWIAHRAGIKVLATGGIGGVHRGLSMDISADLQELVRTPMVVVCSGAKAILDLPATREWLETHGVTIVGYQCDELPGFYSRSSGLPVDARVDSAADVAAIAKAQCHLGIQSALVVAVPVPAQLEVPAAELQEMLATAISEAERQGIHGRELTPFLLRWMADKSGGATLRANVALLENNARVGAEIAKLSEATGSLPSVTGTD